MKSFFVGIDTGGVWHISIFYGLALCVLIISHSQIKKYGLAASTLLAYVVISALYLLEYPDNRFGAWHSQYQGSAGQCLAELGLLTLSVSYIKPKYAWMLLTPLCLFDGLWVLKSGNGLMQAYSFDTAFLAMCLPFVAIPVKIFSLAIIFTRHGYTAKLIIAAQLFAMSFQYKKLRLLIPLIAIVLLSLISHYYSGISNIGIDRINPWHKYMSAWAEDPMNVIFGIGSGSFMWSSVLLDKFQGILFLELHNDWLQILFEQGVIGLILALLTYFSAVKKSLPDPKLLAGVFGAGVFALTYHPLRFIPTAFVTVLIFHTALTKDTKYAAR